MPLKGLSHSQSGRELRRRSTLELLNLSPPARDDIPARGTVSAEFDPRDRPATSDYHTNDDDAQRVLSLVDSPTTTLGPSRPSIDSTWSRPFNFYKWRHASDSHLAAKVGRQRNQNVPPVPALPLEREFVDTDGGSHEADGIAAPLIITTGPTTGPSSETTSTADTRKSRFPMFPRSKSPGPPVPDPSKEKRAVDKKAQKDKRRTMFGSLRMPSKDTADGLQRGVQSLDLNGLMPEQRPSDASDTLAPPSNERLAPSRSHDEHPPLASLFDPSPKRPKLMQAKTWVPKKRKNRESLFPLPGKVTPSQFPNTAPATPRASTSGLSTSGSPHRSPGEPSPSSTSIHRTSTADGISQSQLTTPHHALAATSIAFAAPGTTLFRNDSTSARSDRSGPALPVSHRPSRRRANTLNSLGGRSEDGPMPPPTPPTLGGNSGRNSTSTAGRTSISNLLTLGHRFRHGSDPNHSRQNSPALGVNGSSSGIHSQSNSFTISREALRVTLPDREEGESAAKYLTRVEDCVDRSQIPSVLSKKDDEFFAMVMRSFMRKFAFFGDPIDIAIRKLLMEVDLPKETQHIDRFLQGFADRYHECNPGIFAEPGKAYFTSFSILMLHTDAFNKSNKHKMSKPDYRKNTGGANGSGLSNDVLDYIYDNIVYTAFIKVEDEINLKHLARKSKRTLRKHGTVEQLKTAARPSEPLDPYELILDGRLDTLRPPLKDVMNLDDPYSYIGTASNIDLKSLNRNSKCGVLQIESLRSRPDAFLSPSTIDNPEEARSGLVDLPIDKVGMLWRKDPKKKAARSPWQEWGAILTGSGIAFFKNAGWVKSLMHQHDAHRKHGHIEGSCIFRPPIQQFKPDHVVPTEQGVALHDSSYKRHKNAFVFFSSSGSEEVFLADNENEMNDWLAKINHQASYRTAGIRPRGLVGGNYEGQRQRALRRLQSSTSTRTVQTPTGEVTIQSGTIDHLLAQQISAARRVSMKQKIDELEDGLSKSIKKLEGQLRDARHLLILAPIQQKTREQMVHAAGRMAAQLKWIRIEIWRMKCHRNILALDLDEENKLAGASRSSPSLRPAPSPQLSTQPSSERLPRANGLLQISTPASPSNEAEPQQLQAKSPILSEAKSPTISVRPETKQTQSSQETDLSDEEMFKTPPEHTPQPSPAFPPEAWATTTPEMERPIVPRESSSVSQATLSPRLEPIAADASSTASSIHETPGTPIGSEFSTPVGDEKELESRRARASHARNSRPGTASESEHEFSPAPASPDSRSKSVRRSLHRSLRDGTPMSHRSHRKGKESGSSVLSDTGRNGSIESETLSRAKGSFTVHGKKASVITFGSEWQDMSAEEKLKLRKAAQASDSTPAVPAAVEDEPEPISPTTPPQNRDVRATSISSYQSSAGAARRESNATQRSEPKLDVRSIQERRAARKQSQQSIAGVIGSSADSSTQVSGFSPQVNGVGVPETNGEASGSPSASPTQDTES